MNTDNPQTYNLGQTTNLPNSIQHIDIEVPADIQDILDNEYRGSRVVCYHHEEPYSRYPMRDGRLLRSLRFPVNGIQVDGRFTMHVYGYMNIEQKSNRNDQRDLSQLQHDVFDMIRKFEHERKMMRDAPRIRNYPANLPTMANAMEVFDLPDDILEKMNSGRNVKNSGVIARRNTDITGERHNINWSLHLDDAPMFHIQHREYMVKYWSMWGWQEFDSKPAKTHLHLATGNWFDETRDEFFANVRNGNYLKS